LKEEDLPNGEDFANDQKTIEVDKQSSAAVN
jgi:hypothetical protein